jgi:membrane protein YdbS with pleckstrin-like domain
MSPIRTLEYILQLILVVGFGYLTYLNGFYWSYTAGIVIPLTVMALLFTEDQKQWLRTSAKSRKVRRI